MRTCAAWLTVEGLHLPVVKAHQPGHIIQEAATPSSIKCTGHTGQAAATIGRQGRWERGQHCGGGLERRSYRGALGAMQSLRAQDEWWCGNS